MISKRTKMITAAIGIFFLLISELDLAESNTAGFAGFKSGLPFWMIALTVMAMVFYDFYDETACKSEG